MIESFVKLRDEAPVSTVSSLIRCCNIRQYDVYCLHGQSQFYKGKKNTKGTTYSYLKKPSTWAMQIEMLGMNEVRKIPGYHDKLLKGKRKGQRSIRLSKAYRAFYTEYKYEGINTISIEEINKHEY